MSRIGRKPIVIPAGVTVTVDEAAHTVAVKGPKGSLNSNYHPLMTVKVEGNEVLVTRPNDENLSKSLHGLTRMTEEEKKLLSTFEARLRHLIYLHDELKRENAELKQLLEDEKSELEKARAEYKALESSYTDLKTATTISLNGSDVKETKLRLSKLVREVDKCIALLNE